MKARFNQLVNFFKETRAETKKVVWPDRKYVMVATGIILFLVFITGMYLTVVDLCLTKIFGFLLR